MQKYCNCEIQRLQFFCQWIFSISSPLTSIPLTFGEVSRSQEAKLKCWHLLMTDQWLLAFDYSINWCFQVELSLAMASPLKPIGTILSRGLSFCVAGA